MRVRDTLVSELIVWLLTDVIHLSISRSVLPSLLNMMLGYFRSPLVIKTDPKS